MIRFLIKGVVRDRSRSLLSFIAVTICVLLAVLMRGFMAGVFDDMFRQTAVLQTGHVKVMTRAYDEESDLIPNDLAILGVDSLISVLAQEYPDMFWTSRITFGGLLDAPDEYGETREQGPMGGIAIDMFSEGSRQVEIWELERKLSRGRLPENPDEVLLGEKFSQRLGVGPGDDVTFVGGTMHGSMAFHNFVVAGTVRLGVGGLDRQLLIADIEGARRALDMEDAASEILGFYHNLFYDDEACVALGAGFNAKYSRPEDEFSPVMRALGDQQLMRQMIAVSNVAVWIIILIFVSLVTIVLWNLGLMNGLRRYGELGMRLAMGETKWHVFNTMLGESVIVGLAGAVLGTALGLALVYWMQEVGLDYTELMESFDMPFSGVMRGKVTPDCWYIGFIPGVGASAIGTMLAGRGIFKRQMAQLFKELELEA